MSEKVIVTGGAGRQNGEPRTTPKAVVTGGAGFIGSHLVDELIDQEYNVHVIDNLSGGSKEHVNDKAEFHELDICDAETIRPIFKEARYVFHLAALPRVQFSIENPLQTHEANVTGTLTVLQAAAGAGVKKVVFSSSSSVYGDQETLPLTESMEPNPLSPYALHKYIGELYCTAWTEIYDLPTVCLRYFNVYGSRQDPEGAYALVVAKFLKLRSEGKPLTITGDGEQTRDFTHVRDVVRANIAAAGASNGKDGEAINVGAGNNVSINRIAEIIGGEIEHIEPRFEPRDTFADNARAKELLGWEPTVSLEEGLEELKKEWNI